MVASTSLESWGENPHISFKFGSYPATEPLVLTAGTPAMNSKGINMADYRDQIQTRAGTQTRADIDEGLRSYMLGIYNYMATAIGPVLLPSAWLPGRQTTRPLPMLFTTAR